MYAVAYMNVTFEPRTYTMNGVTYGNQSCTMTQQSDTRASCELEGKRAMFPPRKHYLPKSVKYNWQDAAVTGRGTGRSPINHKQLLDVYVEIEAVPTKEWLLSQ